MRMPRCETAHVVELRGWPGISTWRPPSPRPAGYADGLADRNALVLHAAADVERDGDGFGLGAALLVTGRSRIAAALLVPDDLERERLAALVVWASRQRLDTPRGRAPWTVATLRQFFDPTAKARGPLAFAPNAYGARRLVVGADLGRTFGLVAEHAGTSRRSPGAWTLYLPGWGHQGDDGTWARALPDRPVLRLRSRRVGWQFDWGPTDHGRGRRGGAFLDLLAAAYALDGDRAAGYAEHRAAFGLEPAPLPLRLTLDEEGADELAATVAGLHQMALALDGAAGHWLLDEDERAERRRRLDLSRLASPAGVAAAIVNRFRLQPPLEHLPLSDEEAAAWCEAMHGGRNEAAGELLGVPFPAAACDLTSAFAACANLLGWWPLVTAERLGRLDVTDELRALCEAAVTDPRAALDPAAWRRLGFALAEVRPDGERWPVGLEDERRPDGRLELAQVSSPDRPLRYAWPDVVGAAIASGRVPEVVSATRLVPVGRQRGLRRRVAVLPGLDLDLDEDPAVALARHRQRVKPSDPALAAELRVVLLALCFGNPGRFDPTPKGGERPGPWAFPPVQPAIFAGCRLLLGAFEALVRERGGLPAYAATDAWIVPASPEGGKLDTPSGIPVPLLPWADLDEVIAAFDGLRVFGDDVPVWSVERGTPERPLRSVVWGPLRHAEFTLDEHGEPELVDTTESGLGSRYAAPPGMPDYTRAAVLRAVRAALGLEVGPPPWDDGEGEPFPAIRRLRVVSPEVLASLPASLGAKPGSRFLALEPHDFLGPRTGAVALDPGGDLAGWVELAWVDRHTGEAVWPSTDPREGSCVVRSLAAVAGDALRTRSSEPLGPIVVDPRLVVHRGRVSGVIDADAFGLPGDLSVVRPTYDRGERLEAIHAWAATLGPRAFARRTGLPLKVAERAALGRRVSKQSVAKAIRALRVVDGATLRCPVDDRPVLRSGARFCSPRCRETAAKRRKRARAAEAAS
jgi:hypothetical protein